MGQTPVQDPKKVRERPPLWSFAAPLRSLRSVQPSRPQTCYLHAHVTERTMTRMQLKFENDYITFALTHLL